MVEGIVDDFIDNDDDDTTQGLPPVPFPAQFKLFITVP